MKLTYLLAGLTLVVFSLAACNNEEETKETSVSEQMETDAMLLNTQPASPTGLAGAQSATVVAQPTVAQTQKVTQASTQAAKTAAGMNPAHGEPGHRCDIAVGAPLSSEPAKPAVSKSVTMPQNATAPATQVTPASAKPAASVPASGKVNPAHGEPGHDCAVPVGAPLKS